MKKHFLKISILSVIILPVITFANTENKGVFTTMPLGVNNQNKWIISDINPGGTIAGKIALVNLSKEPIELNLETKNIKEVNGEIKILEDDKDHLAEWTSLSNKSINLKPEEKTTIEYTINVPEKTKTEKYTGAIFASYIDNKSELKIATRIGNRIYLNVTDNKILQSNLLNTNIQTPNYLLIILSIIGVSFSILKIRQKNYAKQTIK